MPKVKCNCAISCNKRFLIDSRDTDFVEKVNKTFLSADIPLYKLNNMHIKNFFRDIGHRLPSETTCTRTALQLSEDELKQL